MVSEKKVRTTLLDEEIPNAENRYIKIQDAVFRSIKKEYPQLNEEEAWEKEEVLEDKLKKNLENYINSKKKRGEIVPFKITGKYLVAKKKELKEKKKIEELLDIFLSEDKWKAFENYCKLILEKMGVRDLEVTPPTGDRGIDIKGKIPLRGISLFFNEFFIDVKAQIKNSSNVNPEQIRSLGSNINQGGEIGIFISHQEHYTKSQKKEAQKNKIFLIARPQLVGILKEENELQNKLRDIISEKTKIQF